MNIDFYLVDDDYLTFLRRFDSRVSANHGVGQRPFVAVLASGLGKDFLIPLTHYVKKRNLGVLPLRLIGTANPEKLGTLLVNNMIPFRSDIATQLNINAVTDPKYQILLRKQWKILRDAEFQQRVEKEVKKAYCFQTNPKNVTNPFHVIFNDFVLLEKAVSTYIKPKKQ